MGMGKWNSDFDLKFSRFESSVEFWLILFCVIV